MYKKREIYYRYHNIIPCKQTKITLTIKHNIGPPDLTMYNIGTLGAPVHNYYCYWPSRPCLLYIIDYFIHYYIKVSNL